MNTHHGLDILCLLAANIKSSRNSTMSSSTSNPHKRKRPLDVTAPNTKSSNSSGGRTTPPQHSDPVLFPLTLPSTHQRHQQHQRHQRHQQHQRHQHKKCRTSSDVTTPPSSAATLPSQPPTSTTTDKRPTPLSEPFNHSPSSIGQAEQKRREKRRLSARRRREKKKFTLNDLETRVNQYRQIDSELRLQMSLLAQNSLSTGSTGTTMVSSTMKDDFDHHDQGDVGDVGDVDDVDDVDDVGDLTKEDTTETPATTLLSKLSHVKTEDSNKLNPSFPNWGEMWNHARQKATTEAQAELLLEATAASSTVAPVARDKNTMRRERNRLSARMSRLRKKIRTKYLEQTILLLHERIKLIVALLESSHHVPVSVLPTDFQQDCKRNK